MIKAIIFDLWNTLAKKEISITRTLSKKFMISYNDDFIKKYEEAIQLQEWDSIANLSEKVLKTF